MKTCTYCNKQMNNSGAHATHEKYCKHNPDRVDYPVEKQLETWVKKIPNTVMFTKNSTHSRRSVKRRILSLKLIKYECDICEIGPKWNSKIMPLILDHINGINNDHRLKNLRFVCSNCDSQLPTYKSKNIGAVAESGLLR